MGAYVNPIYPYKASTAWMTTPPQRKPLIVIGAGPVGLAAAIDARLQGLEVVVFDDDKTVSVGSRAVCYAKRSLEILDRLGIADEACGLGVSWNIGRTFLEEDEVYQFNLVPDAGHKRPGMINLQQYHVEEMLIARALALGADIRWQHKVTAVTRHDEGHDDHATLSVETPDGAFDIEADWLVVADGARSPIRRHLGLDIEGRVFQDRFLIADVIMKADYPAERWFWFDPPFHPNQSVLLHKQSNNVWRIDFQLGWDADPEEEKKPEKVIPRLKAMLGDERPFELEWVSIYTFQCRRMTDFRHGRVLFVGDAAHQVSPFGARGANSGFQDVDDLMWKLALVMKGQASDKLLDTYAHDRQFAADENIKNSTRSTDFITPKSRTSKTFRNQVLALAKHHPFARKLVNSGRLSMPSFLTESVLNTQDTEVFAGQMVPGAPMDDAPVQVNGQDAWLLDQVGKGFQCLLFVDAAPSAETLATLQAFRQGAVSVDTLIVSPVALSVPGWTVVVDAQGWMAKRYDAQAETVYLLRPDQHVLARWRQLQPAAVQAAVARAICQA
ncbi:FAD-dependent oxidoreductase [Limnohabitans sp. MMS-10A-160]|uniref:FAD-dependent oxidoreductase n=1 Tax=unclassified Limnohabitans TaxID=2626134 RepID=UPI000D3347D8|nr:MULTISPECIES: FAD-dependent oxidoreductase [unclassified Limnohabitans]PUE20657.1 FAD-dependent oxidoreductase [Limnohabitans sp. MMS-10A-192]PUE24955.1 FAD-dependent oxidoreductase [Limnohabitans sp. MMS-10A-160]